MFDVDAPPFRELLNPPAPPLALMVNDPLEAEQLALLTDALAVIAFGFVILTVVELVQPLASVATMV